MPARRSKLPRGWVTAPTSPGRVRADRTRPPTPTQPRTDAAGNPVMANGEPNPTGRGPYCAPLRCYCGRCPSWHERPPVDYRAAVARLQRVEAFLPHNPDPED